MRIKHRLVALATLLPDAGVAVNSEQPGRFNELLYTHLGF